ncbi:hypothetical protein [Rubritalea tangerina]
MIRANEARTAGQEASRAAAQVRTENEAIKFDVEKLFMITEALWEILKHQHGYTDEQLTQMIQDIDLRDGKLDGKVAKTSQPTACSGCGRTLIQRQAKCLYCGVAVTKQPFER